MYMFVHIYMQKGAFQKSYTLALHSDRPQAYAHHVHKRGRLLHRLGGRLRRRLRRRRRASRGRRSRARSARRRARLPAAALARLHLLEARPAACIRVAAAGRGLGRRRGRAGRACAGASAGRFHSGPLLQCC